MTIGDQNSQQLLGELVKDHNCGNVPIRTSTVESPQSDALEPGCVVRIRKRRPCVGIA